MASLPPPGSDFEEEEEEHEDEAGADVENHTQTHVHAVEAQSQDPNSTAASSAHYLLPLLPRPPTSPCCGWRLPLRRPGWTGSSRERRGEQGVPGGQVGGSVVVSQELEDVVLVPNMDAVVLLMAGGAEGGAWPRGFGEQRVVTQRA